VIEGPLRTFSCSHSSLVGIKCFLWWYTLTAPLQELQILYRSSTVSSTDTLTSKPSACGLGSSLHMILSYSSSSILKSNIEPQERKIDLPKQSAAQSKNTHTHLLQMLSRRISANFTRARTVYVCCLCLSGFYFQIQTQKYDYTSVV